MTDKQSIRDELAFVLAEWHDRNRNPEQWVIDMYEGAADRMLASPVIRLIQAEAYDLAVSGMYSQHGDAYTEPNPYQDERA